MAGCDLEHGCWSTGEGPLLPSLTRTAVSQGSSCDDNGGSRYVDATLTVPKAALHTASAANLAFDRSLGHDGE